MKKASGEPYAVKLTFLGRNSSFELLGTFRSLRIAKIVEAGRPHCCAGEGLH